MYIITLLEILFFMFHRHVGTIHLGQFTTAPTCTEGFKYAAEHPIFSELSKHYACLMCIAAAVFCGFSSTGFVRYVFVFCLQAQHVFYPCVLYCHCS